MIESATLPIQTLAAAGLSEADLRGVCELHQEAFDRPGRSLDQRLAEARARWIDPDIPDESGRLVHLIRDGERVVGVSMSLVRVIRTEQGPLTVLGLAGVATAGSHRGRGLGKRVIQAAWHPVDEGRYPVCLFQTGAARGLYERLGARVVDNRFVDSTDAADPEANPFRDEVAMIYPGTADWPAGTIDLQGPGY